MKPAKKLPHHIAIVVKFHGPGNVRGWRVSLSVPYWKGLRKKVTKSIPYDHSHSSTLEIANRFLSDAGVNLESVLTLPGCYIMTAPWEERERIFAALGMSEKPDRVTEGSGVTR